MKLSHFLFELPEERLAEYPAENRDESKLMVLNRKEQTIEHKSFKDIIDYFDEDDVMVLNNTKVFPARLYGNKEKTGARIEVFLLRELNSEQRLWDVLVDPARKIRIGNKLYFGDDDTLVAEVIDNTTSKRRICAFGTTSMRAIESSVSSSGTLNVYNGWTNKFIFPPYEFSIANCMVTNFHMPKSTLMMMTSAFAGHDFMLRAYEEAIKKKYNFFSYGDAMLII